MTCCPLPPEPSSIIGSRTEEVEAGNLVWALSRESSVVFTALLGRDALRHLWDARYGQ
jgi:hypothetical protein